MSILFVKSERFDASSRVYIANKYDLVITNVKREDNGMYACRTKDAGIQTATLTVLLPPGTTSITRDDISPVYTEGKVVKFKCSSSGGNPPPTIIWLKNGNISAEIPEYKASTELAGVSSSTITVKLDKTDHQANYSCLVYNEVNVNNKLLDYVVLNVKYSPSIAFQPYSPVYFVKMGVNIEIFCDVDANPAVSSVTWSKDGIGLSGTSPRRVLSPVTKSDNGTYTCTAKNSIGEHSGSFDVNVQYAPNLSAQPTLTANEGDSVTLNCMIDANPKPFEVVWSKMSPNGSLQNKVTSSTFKIATVSRTDAGNYSCRAQSQLRISGENVEFVTSEVFTYLYVQYKPGKASLGPVPDLDVGDRLEILCTATPNGYPEPVYTWMKDGQTLPQNRQSFVISSVKLTDNGRYSCTPSNNRGRGDPAFVDVNIFEPPTIIRKPEVELSVFLSEPNLLALTCEVRGYPQPRVNWYQEGETQSLNTRPDLFTVITTNRPGDGLSSRVESILQFKGNSRTLVTSSGQRIGLQIRDMGNYSCQADSDKHTDTPTTNTRVYINFPPVLEASPKILAASKMERAELSCAGQGYPEPSIQWSSQGQVLTSQPAVLSVTQQTLSGVGRLESKLSILNVTDKSYGTYKCTLRNALGNASQEIVLTNKSPPEQPLNVTAGSITWESVMLTWVPGFDGGMSQRFFIQFYSTGTSFGLSQKLEVLPTSSRYFNVTKLHPSKTYTFQVVAENDLGFGPASLPVVVTTSSLLIPSLNKIPVFDSRSRKLVVTSTYDNNYCLKVEVKTSRTDWTQTHGCMMVMGGTMEVSNVDVTAINVTVCLSQRPEVCGLPVTAEFKSSNEAQLTEEHVIIIACVCGVIIVTLLIILFCFIFRRRRNAAKSYQSGNQGEPPPYNAVPPSKKPQGFDNQGMDTSDLQQTPSPSPSVHAITTSYTNSSYPNRMESFQARDNPVPVTRSNTKDKYIDLHDRGSDPMMGPDTPGYNGALDQGSNAKPKKVIYEVVV
uniref:Uncharacterized protein n=1 Tax=Biomphalaria glabrata TaxID=6526 RepID=A0A2C9LCF1_BIOGL